MKSPAIPSALWTAIATAQRQISLYGARHPNTAHALRRVLEAFHAFASDFGNATCVFTDDSVVVGAELLELTSDAARLRDRLRDRGCMAFALAGCPADHEVEAFLAFLNTPPDEVRLAGGPLAWISSAGVVSFVLAPAVYACDEESGRDGTGDERLPGDEGRRTVDAAVAAVISRLAQADEEDWQALRPLASILADADSACALISEAIQSLQAGGYGRSGPECAQDVIDHLKDLAQQDPEQWDMATPALREAVANLPEDSRPVSCPLRPLDILLEQPEAGGEDSAIQASAVETQIEEALRAAAGGGSLDASALEALFDAQVQGRPEIWNAELQQQSYISASARTFAHLLVWERNAAEHATIAGTLAGLVGPALEAGGAQQALMVAQALLSDAGPGGESHWRMLNVRTAVRSIDPDVLLAIVEEGVESRSYQGLETARALLDHFPEIARGLLHLLGASHAEFLAESLKSALVEMGESVVGDLGRLVRSGAASAREPALRILLDIPGAGARREALSILHGADPLFVVRALAVAHACDGEAANALCMEALRNPSADIRCAALDTLGRQGNREAIEAVAPFLCHRLFKGPGENEQIAACRCLGAIGGDEARALLQRAVERRPLLGRRRYELVRRAAEEALAGMELPLARAA